MPLGATCPRRYLHVERHKRSQGRLWGLILPSFPQGDFAGVWPPTSAGPALNSQLAAILLVTVTKPTCGYQSGQAKCASDRAVTDEKQETGRYGASSPLICYT